MLLNSFAVASMISFLASSYTYNEPGVMDSTGFVTGIGGSIAIEQVRLDGNLHQGAGTYTSNRTGTHADDPVFYYELRGFYDLYLSPSHTLGLGVGRRELTNDSTGAVTSTGHIGYLRESTYTYLPIELQSKWPWFFTQAEYDVFLAGEQRSHNFGTTYTYRQNFGYGWRFAIGFNVLSTVALDFFIKEWQIKESEHVQEKRRESWEPSNWTREMGVRIAKEF